MNREMLEMVEVLAQEKACPARSSSVCLKRLLPLL